MIKAQEDLWEINIHAYNLIYIDPGPFLNGQRDAHSGRQLHDFERSLVECQSWKVTCGFYLDQLRKVFGLKTPPTTYILYHLRHRIFLSICFAFLPQESLVVLFLESTWSSMRLYWPCYRGFWLITNRCKVYAALA